METYTLEIYLHALIFIYKKNIQNPWVDQQYRGKYEF